MTTQDALLAAILANPDDDAVREQYADWCDENGQPERAEFIRVQCRLHEIGGTPTKAANEEWRLLHRRVFQLWNAPLVLRELPDGAECELPAMTLSPGEHVRLERSCLVRRGFIAEIRCTLDEWCGGLCNQCNGSGVVMGGLPCWCNRGPHTAGIGPAVVRSQPVERVVLTDRVPYETGVTAFPYAAFITADVGRPDFLPLSLLTDDEQKAMAAGAFRQHVVYATTVEEFTSEVSKRLIAWAKSQPHPARITSHPVAVDLES